MVADGEASSGDLALLIAFIRLVKGPTLPDRIVAMDLFGMLVVGLIAFNQGIISPPLQVGVVVHEDDHARVIERRRDGDAAAEQD